MYKNVILAILLSLVALQVFAWDEIKAVIRDGQGKPMATVTYSYEKKDVRYEIETFPGLLLKDVGRRVITQHDHNISPPLTVTIFVFEIINPFTGGGVRLEIGSANISECDCKTGPIVSRLDRTSPLMHKTIIKPAYFIDHSTISHAVNLIKDLPKPFQKTVHYPKSTYDQHMQENAQFYRSMLERFLERREQFQDFKNRTRNALGAPYAQREEDVRLQIQAAMDGLDVYDEDIRFVQTSANALLRQSLPSIKPVDFVAEELAPVEILAEQEAFNKALYANITTPTFFSDLLQFDIKFDPQDDSDLSALTIYRNAQKQKSKRQKKDQRYYELDFSQNIIEIRQAKKTQFKQTVLDRLSDIATAVNEQNNRLLIESLSFFSKSEDFQKGLAASFANNINPVSFLYPIQAGCESNWCELGGAVGDASSMLLGALELLGGVGLTIGGSGLAVGSALAASGGAIPALAAASAGALAVIEGLALASHGASVFSNAFGSMYDKITSKFNLRQVFKSKKVMDSAGNFVGKNIDDVKKFAKNIKKSPDNNFQHVLYPRGKGASSLPAPKGYTKVSRWVNQTEVKPWFKGGGTRIPQEIGANNRLYVTKFGAPKPGGTGPIRIDFEVPGEMLQRAGSGEWRQILQPQASSPIYNVEIFLP
ncbi:MAG: hypothetical protein ISR65_08900 [Bacteriovoracaceae bacterium]|nr:hypothetical protein [Bacteriovoracaceae bacterium]